MKTVTYTPDNFLLKDGEVHVVMPLWTGQGVLATTDKELSDAISIPHLERELFVKPVDVEALAHEFMMQQEGFNDADNSWQIVFKNIFKAGYAAANSKGEFTREEAHQAMWDAMAFVDSNPKASPKGIDDYVNNRLDNIRPLSLPKEIQVIDNNWNNPKIVW